MLWHIFQRIEPTLVKLYRKVSKSPIPNLKGERDVEYSWVATNMPEGSGDALDFGCGLDWMGLLAARKGFNVAAIDLQFVTWYYEHPNLGFVQGNIFKLNFPREKFDLIINCSSVEHVGLVGRYGVSEFHPDGDIEAMALLKNILKPGKVMILTIPVGRDRIFYPLHRVYGEKRLPRLLQGWEVVKKEYWVKNNLNRWICVEELAAFNKEALEYCYGLGLFVLRRPVGSEKIEER